MKSALRREESLWVSLWLCIGRWLLSVSLLLWDGGVVKALLEVCYLCGFWHAPSLTFSDENVLAREECCLAQPFSAPGLKALPFTTQGPSLCKHTPILKAAGLSSFPPALRCLLVET